jgi:cell division protein FtsN
MLAIFLHLQQAFKVLFGIALNQPVLTMVGIIATVQLGCKGLLVFKVHKETKDLPAQPALKGRKVLLGLKA